MKDFLGQEIQVGDLCVANINTSTGTSTSRRCFYKGEIVRIHETMVEVKTEHQKRRVLPENIVKISTATYDVLRHSMKLEKHNPACDEFK